uniref:Fanconi anemia group M protein isoform X2 n=1 Tax=Myxine glutinosa TaxID=7769 RepID=UPI00358F635F
MQSVQQILTNLLISHVEIRSDDSPDILPYSHQRSVEKHVIPLGERLSAVRDNYLKILEAFTSRLIRLSVLSRQAIPSLCKYQLILARDQFRKNPLSNMSAAQQGVIEGDFALCISLYHGYELLQQMGTRSLLLFLQGIMDGTKGMARARYELCRNQDFLELYCELEKERKGQALEKASEDGAVRVTPALTPFVYSHPKLKKLEEVVLEHFQQAGGETRAMIFSSYRDSVGEIAEMLRRHHPLVRVMVFIGQSSSGKVTRGLSQKEQLQVVKSFREGGYNTLVSTCVGEEGLDIGEVDLIVCFDAQRSPVRLVQRMGRTGRQRPGRIVVILCEGREEKVYNQSQSSKQCIHRAIVAATSSFQLYPLNPRMVPASLTPKVHFMHIAAGPAYNRQTASRGRQALTTCGSDGFLMPAELVEFEAKFAVEDDQQPMLARPAYFQLGDGRKPLGKCRELSLSEWPQWQTKLQLSRYVSHSNTTHHFVKLMNFIDVLKLSEDDDTYDREMAAHLDLADVSYVCCDSPNLHLRPAHSSGDFFLTSRKAGCSGRRKDRLQVRNRSNQNVLRKFDGETDPDFASQRKRCHNFSRDIWATALASSSDDIDKNPDEGWSMLKVSSQQRQSKKALPLALPFLLAKKAGEKRATVRSEADFHDLFFWPLEQGQQQIWSNLCFPVESGNVSTSFSQSCDLLSRSPPPVDSLLSDLESEESPNEGDPNEQVPEDFEDEHGMSLWDIETIEENRKEIDNVKQRPSISRFEVTDKLSESPLQNDEMKKRVIAASMFSPSLFGDDDVFVEPREVHAGSRQILKTSSELSPCSGALVRTKGVSSQSSPDCVVPRNSGQESVGPFNALFSLTPKLSPFTPGSNQSTHSSNAAFSPELFSVCFDLGIDLDALEKNGIDDHGSSAHDNLKIVSSELEQPTCEIIAQDYRAMDAEGQDEAPLVSERLTKHGENFTMKVHSRQPGLKHSPHSNLSGSAQTLSSQEGSMKASCSDGRQTPRKSGCWTEVPAGPLHCLSNTGKELQQHRAARNDTIEVVDEEDKDELLTVFRKCDDWPRKMSSTPQPAPIHSQDVYSPIGRPAKRVPSWLNDSPEVDFPITHPRKRAALDLSDSLSKTSALENDNDADFETGSVKALRRSKASDTCKRKRKKARKTEHQVNTGLEYLDLEADVVDHTAEISDDESDGSIGSLQGFINDKSMAPNDTVMQAVYMKSLRSPHMPSARYKMVYKEANKCDVLSQEEPPDDDSYQEDSFCVASDEVDEVAVGSDEEDTLLSATHHESFAPVGQRHVRTRRRAAELRKTGQDEVRAAESTPHLIANNTGTKSASAGRQCRRRILVVDGSSEDDDANVEKTGDPESEQGLGTGIGSCVVADFEISLEEDGTDSFKIPKQSIAPHCASSKNSLCKNEPSSTSRNSPGFRACVADADTLDFQNRSSSSLSAFVGVRDSRSRAGMSTEDPVSMQADAGSSCSSTHLKDASESTQRLLILVDSREISSGQDVLSCLRLRHDIQAIVCSCLGAAYAVSTRSAVERRGQMELGVLASKSKLAERVRALLYTFERLYLIVERERMRQGECARAVVRTRCFDTTLVSLAAAGVRVLHSASQEQTAAVLAEIAATEASQGAGLAGILPPNMRSPMAMDISGTALSHPAVRMYRAVPQLGYVAALLLCRKFRSVRQAFGSSVSELCEKGQLSRQQAEALHRFVRYNFDPTFLPEEIMPPGNTKQS